MTTILLGLFFSYMCYIGMITADTAVICICIIAASDWIATAIKSKK